MTQDEIREALRLPKGCTRGIVETIAIAMQARVAVFCTRRAILLAGTKDLPQVALRWEALAQNLYFAESAVADRILPLLERQGVFGVLGPGGVAPVSLDGPAVGIVTFLGRRLPMRRVAALNVTFEPEIDEAFRIVAAQAAALEKALRPQATRGLAVQKAMVLASLAALAFWR